MKRIISLCLILVFVLSGCTTHTKTSLGIPIDGGRDEQIKADLSQIGEDECLLIGLDQSYNIDTGGYTYRYAGFYNNSFQIIAEFYNVDLDLLPGIYKKDIVFMVGLSNYKDNDYNNINLGLYDLKAKEYLLEPIYDYDQLVECSKYEGKAPEDKIYLLRKTEGQFCFYNGQGQEIYKELVKGKTPFNLSRVGDYTWLYDEKNREALVYDQNNNLMTNISCSLFDKDRMNGYVITYTLDEEALAALWTEGGKEVKFIDHLMEQLPLESNKVSSITFAKEESQIISCIIGEYQILYDLEKQKVIDYTNDEAEILAVFETFYTKDEKTFYRLDGTKIEASKLKKALVTIFDNHIVTSNGKQLFVYQVSTDTSWKWDSHDQYVFHCDPNKQFYIVESEDGRNSKLYYKNKLILDNTQFEFISQDGRYTIVSEYKGEEDQEDIGHRFLLDDKGNIVYETKDGEELLGVYKNYLAIKRGNYVGLTDLKGDFICKTLDPLLGDD